MLESLDEAVAALALVPDRAAAKEVLSLRDLSHFTLLPTSYPWGDVLFSTDAATKAGLHAVRNTLALRRLSSDAPALGSEEKLRFLRSWLLGLATALASVFEPLGREGTHPRVRQLMLDRLGSHHRYQTARSAPAYARHPLRSWRRARHGGTGSPDALAPAIGLCIG